MKAFGVRKAFLIAGIVLMGLLAAALLAVDGFILSLLLH